jgi:hypothetical protein
LYAYFFYAALVEHFGGHSIGLGFAEAFIGFSVEGDEMQDPSRYDEGFDAGVALLETGDVLLETGDVLVVFVVAWKNAVPQLSNFQRPQFFKLGKDSVANFRFVGADRSGFAGCSPFFSDEGYSSILFRDGDGGLSGSI